MIAGAILAAGMSQRFGENKLLMPLGEQSIVEHVIDGAKSSTIDSVFLIYGHRQGEFEKIIQRKQIKGIYNPDYHLGQSMSVKRAVEVIGDKAKGIMFLLGDQPFIHTDTLNLLIHHFNKHPQGIILPMYEGKRGNPVIFSRDFFPEMKSLQGDKGPRDMIKKYNQRVVKVPISRVVENFDIDTTRDYQKAIRYRRKWK